MLTTKEIQTLNELYQKMSSEQETKFLKTHNLFYASFLSPFTIDEEDEETYFDKLLVENPDHEDIDKFINRLQERIENDQHYIVINASDIKQGYRHVTDYSWMKVIDQADFGKFLILSATDKSTDYYREKVKNNFEITETYNFDMTICKALLPKMLKAFKDTTVSYPPDITEEEWDKILLKLIWFCEEIVYTHDQMLIDKFDDYNKKYNECKELMGKYFDHLWS